MKEKISDLGSNLTLAESTLPGLIISIMHNENSPMTINQILPHIYNNYENLRKANGSKYNVTYKLT
jgi:hypothetical protein